jgi:hypothetical protein
MPAVKGSCFLSRGRRRHPLADHYAPSRPLVSLSGPRAIGIRMPWKSPRHRAAGPSAIRTTGLGTESHSTGKRDRPVGHPALFDAN